MTPHEHSSRWDRLAVWALWTTTSAWLLIPSAFVIRHGLYGAPCFAALPSLMLMFPVSLAFGRAPARSRAFAGVALALAATPIIAYLALSPSPFETHDTGWWWWAIPALFWHIGCAVLVLSERWVLLLVAAPTLLIAAGQSYRLFVVAPNDAWHRPPPWLASDLMLWIAVGQADGDSDRRPWVEELRRRPYAAEALTQALERCPKAWHDEPYPCRALMRRETLLLFRTLAPREAQLALERAAQNGPAVFRLQAIDALTAEGGLAQQSEQVLLKLPSEPEAELARGEVERLVLRIGRGLGATQRRRIVDAWSKAPWTSARVRDRFVAMLSPDVAPAPLERP